MFSNKKKYLIIAILLSMNVFLYFQKHENNEKEIFSQKSHIVENLNEKLRKINNISIYSNYGDITYEKNLKITSDLKYFNLGSNEDYFWYFLKNKMYYCEHKDLFSTRLKKFLYPKILKSILSIDEIKYFKLNENSKQVICYEKIYENITRKIFLEDGKIVKQEFYYIDNKILAVIMSNHIEISNIFYPQKIEFNIIEENLSFNLIINQVKFNQKLNKNWKMPNNNNKINLKDY